MLMLNRGGPGNLFILEIILIFVLERFVSDCKLTLITKKCSAMTKIALSH